MGIRDGAIQSPLDTRDYIFKDLVLQVKPQIPPKVDLRNLDQPIRNQGIQGSCTAFSSTSARQILTLQKTNYTPILSPAFTYYFSRIEAFGDPNSDQGCYLRSVMKTWLKYGCCIEDDFPYNDQIFNIAPDNITIQNALVFRINRYFRIYDLFDIQSALVLRLPVIISINTNLIAGMTGLNGSINDPSLSAGFTGDHAMVIVGYYDHPGYEGGGFLVVKNSWGLEWGNQGYFYLPYRYIQDSTWFTEGWVMEV